MRLTICPAAIPAAILAAAIVAAPQGSAAQAPAQSLEQLKARLQPGDTIWVTDAQGREVKGIYKGSDAAGLRLKRWRTKTIDASGILAVDASRPDPTWDGAVKGAAVGLAVAAVCYGAALREGEPEMIGFAQLGLVLFSVVGANMGWEADHAKTGPRFTAYRAPAAGSQAGRRRLSVAPVITPRAKGVALAFSY